MTKNGVAKETSFNKTREDIFNYPKSRAIYKNTFPELCFKMTCMAEQCFLSMLSPQMLLAYMTDIGAIQDKIRDSYRETLKWAFRFAEHSDSFSIPLIYQKDVDAIMREFEEAEKYNLVRKAFDDYDIKKYSGEMNEENEITFKLNSGARDIGADIYAHWVDFEKPEDQLNDHKSKAILETSRLMMDPKIGTTWKPYENKPVGRSMFKKYYHAAYEKVIADAEEKEDYCFEKYTLEHFRMVYAGIMALGLMRTHDMFIGQCLAVKNAQSYDKNRPIVYGKTAWLISFFAQSLELDKEEITNILHDLTYDGAFHKDKITIVQPLFMFDQYFFFSPSIVYYSLQQDKLLFTFKEQKRNLPILSAIAHDREDIMTRELVEEIQKKSGLICKTNYKLSIEEENKAEFDLLVFDPAANKLLLTELKWFYKTDGEYGHYRLDKRIQQSIDIRLQREQLAQNHLSQIMQDCFEKYQMRDLPEIMSCIVSKNYSGSSFIEEKIPIFDQFLFLTELEKSKYSLSSFFEEVKNHLHYPTMEDCGLKIEQIPVEYAGYKIWIPGYKAL